MDAIRYIVFFLLPSIIFLVLMWVCCWFKNKFNINYMKYDCWFLIVPYVSWILGFESCASCRSMGVGNYYFESLAVSCLCVLAIAMKYLFFLDFKKHFLTFYLVFICLLCVMIPWVFPGIEFAE
jgi:hypothetical protein